MLRESDEFDRFDIVICGAGLVGLLLANLLKGSGFRIAIVDAGSEPLKSTQGFSRSPEFGLIENCELDSGFAPRVSALNSHSISLLERCDVMSEIKRYAPFSRMEIKDGEGTGEISFDAHDLNGSDQLGAVVENHLVISALANRLNADDDVELLFEHRLEEIEDDDGERELIFADGKTLRCQLLVAADGGNSIVRELEGHKTLGWQYDQLAVVTTIACAKPHDSIPRQWFTSSGPLAFLPLAEPNLCSIVWSHKNANELLELDSPAFCAELTAVSEGELGEVLGADKRFSYPLRQQHALRYSKPGVVLIGDAAHAIHPLAGQGANLGFGDASALASELRQSMFSDLGLADPTLLSSYTLSRQPHNLAVAAAMEAIKHLYGSQMPIIGFARNGLMRLANRNGSIKSLLMKVAGGLS